MQGGRVGGAVGTMVVAAAVASAAVCARLYRGRRVARCGSSKALHLAATTEDRRPMLRPGKTAGAVHIANLHGNTRWTQELISKVDITLITGADSSFEQVSLICQKISRQISFNNVYILETMTDYWKFYDLILFFLSFLFLICFTYAFIHSFFSFSSLFFLVLFFSASLISFLLFSTAEIEMFVSVIFYALDILL